LPFSTILAAHLYMDKYPLSWKWQKQVI
jgi:hypothetical protein